MAFRFVIGASIFVNSFSQDSCDSGTCSDESTMLQVRKTRHESDDVTGVTYHVAMPDKKCPFDHEDRLFRLPTEGSSGVTIEQCHAKCASTTGCKHFSYGPWEGEFVCMGCTQSVNAQTHEGLALYDAYPVAMQGKKCPLGHEDRLFRTPQKGVSAVTIGECHAQCATTPGCNHFSYGAYEDAFVCMGCTQTVNVHDHDGFTVFDMYQLSMTDKKCPLGHDDRLFRTPEEGSSDVTIEDCHQQCRSTEGCNHFSYGPWQGAYVCMGCTQLDNVHDHDELNVYDLQ